MKSGLQEVLITQFYLLLECYLYFKATRHSFRKSDLLFWIDCLIYLYVQMLKLVVGDGDPALEPLNLAGLSPNPLFIATLWVTKAKQHKNRLESGD